MMKLNNLILAQDSVELLPVDTKEPRLGPVIREK